MGMVHEPLFASGLTVTKANVRFSTAAAAAAATAAAAAAAATAAASTAASTAESMLPWCSVLHTQHETVYDNLAGTQVGVLVWG
jgi:hypothetical protein